RGLGAAEACRSGAPDDEEIALEAHGQRRQTVARARSAGAEPRVRLVERAVRRADQGATVLGEELVRPEGERRADVGAEVDVRAVAAVVVHDEAADRPAATLEPERGRVA